MLILPCKGTNAYVSSFIMDVGRGPSGSLKKGHLRALMSDWEACWTHLSPKKKYENVRRSEKK